MSERIGVIAAIVSCAAGGAAAVATRFVIGAVDPITIAAFRFGLGFAVLLPLTLALRSRWPSGHDWIGVALLGLMFFGLFFVLYNISLSHTTTARGTLALSVLPLVTMAVAALLGVERLTARKSTGVVVAVLGVAATLAAGLGDAPEGAWRGDLIMVGATLCMALYSIWSRPYVRRSSPLAFVTAGMGCGALCLVVVAAWSGGFVVARQFDWAQWLAIFYLGAGGGALAFYLWVFALERASPTRVANTMTVNPVVSSVLAAWLLGEPLGFHIAAGIAAVGAGIWIATVEPRSAT
ncbi:MAG: DMT family transporter [Alphaproteobacteria bacterium]|nr:DMT family transporter [Alphaproteobacteria bacterium]